MRVALISEHASPLAALGGVDSGGQNVYVAHVAKQLTRAGHKVDVFTRLDDPALPPVVHLDRNLRVLHIPAGPVEFVPKERLLSYMGGFGDGVSRICRSQTPYDIVHANFFMSGLVALRLKKLLALPFVMSFHALGRVRQAHQAASDGFPPERIAIEEALVRRADRLIAGCPQDRVDLIDLYAADPARIAMVPCGFAQQEFAPEGQACRAGLGLGAEEFVVLQLGRLVPRKGIDNVIRAIGQLRTRHGIRARLMIVGGNSDEPDTTATPEIGRLQAIANDEGVTEQVVFTGRRPRSALREYYCAADVFVTTPWYEPFGITPLEAMACGTPVIGADVGGVKFTVVDGVTGFLVPPRDPQSLADRLAQLRRNPELARALGRAGIRRARSLFSWKRVVEQLSAVYADMLPLASSPALAASAGQ
jgi:D-inositol-3-phosphate glycosyltransferase